MSWVKERASGQIVSTSQEVEVMVLEVDSEKRRISLGLKQCMANPWEDFASRYPVGTKVSGEIKNITEFGLFVGLEDEIDGMVHMRIWIGTCRAMMRLPVSQKVRQLKPWCLKLTWTKSASASGHNLMATRLKVSAICAAAARQPVKL